MAQLFGSQQVISNTAGGARDIKTADLDGDGDLDVFAANQFDNQVAWYKNIDGHGTFSTINTIAMLSETRFVEGVDIDGDSDVDIIATSSPDDLIVWYENLDGLGNFSSQNIITDNLDRALNVIATDLDGDGDPDIISVGDFDRDILWYENTDGQGTFSSAKIVSTIGNNARGLFAADIDGDDDMDIIASSIANNGITWFENTDGLGNFSSTNSIFTGFTTNDVFAIDIDGDTDLDIVSASVDCDCVSWYENIDGLGAFGPPNLIIDNFDFALWLFVADLDNDGDNDVIATAAIDDKVSWFENTNGLGTFGGEQIITLNADSSTRVWAADIDNDGDLDVLSASRNNNLLAWYENTTILGIEDTVLDFVQLYPNPTKNRFYIANLDNPNIQVHIRDASGKLLLQEIYTNKGVDISRLANGVLFVTIHSQETSKTFKFIKQ